MSVKKRWLLFGVLSVFSRTDCLPQGRGQGSTVHNATSQARGVYLWFPWEKPNIGNAVMGDGKSSATLLGGITLGMSCTGQPGGVQNTHGRTDSYLVLHW